ncbi:MAG: erythromycin biosynthesis sensory transduction protein eryC1 [candidate division Zixibacteria bacterium SM23_81]|nr:MAG: erythromycin biosynthesis sensory transduction protein eryC1 [candidate division Zixibacteria bacterium SM23_81]
MNVPFVDLKAQLSQIRDEINLAIQEVIDKCSFVGGPHLKVFEDKFAAFCEAKHAIGVSSGTAALHVSLVACDIGPGDEVITVPNTFIATTEAITLSGASPVFVDVDLESYNIDVSKIEGAITPRTKAIMPVHLYGQPADMDPILEIASRHGLTVIEDACQAHGAEYKGRKVGALGRVGCISFYPGKNLGAYGDGGMVLTNDSQLADKIRILCNHGQAEKNKHTREGFNYRLDGIQAAVLTVKLRHLEDWTRRRRNNAQRYSELLQDVDIITPIEKKFAKHVFHLYIIRLKDRDALAEHLQAHGVAVGFHYPIALHLQEAYAHLGFQPGAFPVAEQCAAQVLSLPMFAELSEEQIQHVIQGIKKFV